ncbi:BtrH N-terminal domain-containing protein [Bacillus fungorum]|uniref:BtrH N-terminal domain-containing protein n=1 Tax=Bacillus fungorum TaxID=2039284 RepID=UPI00339137C7
MESKHCLYDSISWYLEKEISIKISPFLIFHLLGGYSFYYKIIDNDIVPNYILRGNRIYTSNFVQHTGIEITTIHEKSYGDALTNTISIIQNRPQLVFTNCYYLDYDTKNYRQNYDTHTVLIQKYKNIEREFIVSDYNQENISIGIDTLMQARENVQNRPFAYLDINATNNYKNLEYIYENVRSLIFLNCKKYLENGVTNLVNFKDEVVKVINLDSIYQKVALYALSKAIRHPHGPVITRYIMGKSLTNFYNEEIINEYINLSKLWRLFADKLIKMKLGKIEKDEIIILFDELIYCERNVNEKLFKLI